MRLCVFCGSAVGSRPIYVEATRALARALCERKIGVVYGGGNVGLMGVLADAMLEHGGEVVGVIPQKLVEREVAHQRLTTLHVVADMHERKATMARLSDGFVALPGGVGTLEELFEVWTWSALGIHHKPCAVYNVGNYWTPLLTFLSHAAEEGFLRRADLAALVVADDVDALLTTLATYRAPPPKY